MLHMDAVLLLKGEPVHVFWLVVCDEILSLFGLMLYFLVSPPTDSAEFWASWMARTEKEDRRVYHSSGVVSGVTRRLVELKTFTYAE